MKRKFIVFSTIVILFYAFTEKAIAQDDILKDNYAGFIPSFLVEPYDTVNAVEVNLFPFMYEFRVGKKNHIGLQVRPILNYRFLDIQYGFSQIGGTLLLNKYFLQ